MRAESKLPSAEQIVDRLIENYGDEEGFDSVGRPFLDRRDDEDWGGDNDSAHSEFMADAPYDEDDSPIDGVGFADPGGNSALRAATDDNPRIFPCPDCGAPERLTRIDVARGYCCNACADRKESGTEF